MAQRTKIGSSPIEHTEMLAHLADEIRFRREAAGMSRQALATLVMTSAASVASYETGHRPLNAVFVFQCDEILEAGGALTRLWERITKATYPTLSPFLQMEALATQLRSFEPSVIPSLLQTTAYAEAVFAAAVPTRSAAETQSLARTRAERAAGLRQDDPPVAVFAIDESALRRMPADRAVAKGQFAHLLDMAELAHVTVLIVPFGANMYVGMAGAFSVFSFEEGADAGYAATFEAARIVIDTRTVNFMREAFERVLTAALPESQSRDFIQSILEST